MTTSSENLTSVYWTHYVNDLWYPIVAKENGTCQIVEMLGQDINDWYQQLYETTYSKYPITRLSIV